MCPKTGSFASEIKFPDAIRFFCACCPNDLSVCEPNRCPSDLSVCEPSAPVGEFLVGIEENLEVYVLSGYRLESD